MAQKRIPITDVYGIIYGIKCEATNKVYVGQTLSHIYNFYRERWCRYGLKGRWKAHTKLSVEKKNQLGKDISKYGEDNFEIFQIDTCPGDKINELDQMETKAIESYDSMSPKGYNTRLHDNCMSRGKKELFDHYGLQEITYYKKKSSGRNANNLKTLSLGEKLDYLKKLSIINVKVNFVWANGQARVYVRAEEHDTVRINITRENEIDSINEAIEFAKELVSIPILSQEVKSILDGREIYKYQDKLDNFKDLPIRLVTGSIYSYQSKCVYNIAIYLTEGKRKSVAFGGKTYTSQQAYDTAIEFINRLEKSNKSQFEKRLKEPKL